MPELADVVRLHGTQYAAKFGAAMLPSHRRALNDILACRTPAMGGHVFECEQCRYVHYACHSCRNRSCPKCHGVDTQQWIDKRRDELLPVPYFHVVFTIPRELHLIARANQSAFYAALMNSAAAALMKLCADPRFLGGTVGLMAVLHTWTRTLVYHPHVHCLVPAGGVHDGHWLSAPRDNFLVPVRALSKIFQGILLEILQRQIPQVEIPRGARRAKWVVFAKPAVQGSEAVLQYLGRYVHRIAISNARIVSVDQNNVSLRYQDSAQRTWKLLTLPGKEFLRRYLQHVLPRGFHKVRYYGLWAPANRKLLRRIQLSMSAHASHQVAPDHQSETAGSNTAHKCPRCLQQTLRFAGIFAPNHLPPRTREPP